MRAVYEPKMLRTEYEAATREAHSTEDGTVYVERLLTGSECEIQVLCDQFGIQFT